MFPKIKLPQKPVYQKVHLPIDFFEFFQIVEQTFTNCFILESLGDQNFDSRYSVIGFDPITTIFAKEQTLIIKLNQNGSEIWENLENLKVIDNCIKLENINPYWVLRQIVPQNIISRTYAGGLVGYISYEAINYFEPKLNLSEHPDFQQFHFGVYTDGLVYDEMTGEINYFYYSSSRLPKILQLAQTKPKKTRINIEYLGDSIDKNQHKEIVNRTIEEIKAGNSFQCEVGFKSKYRLTGNGYLQIYEKLREVNPSPYMFYCKFDTEIVLGASPELLFRARNREIETFPLAGTIGRGETVEQDRELAKQLLNDPKEIAEHNMLVDLHRNDIGKVSMFGTVKVRRLMDIKKFSHVQHISSEIVGILKENEDMFTGLASVFPGGVLTGAPKIETIKIINQNENEPRGPYGGAFGHFGFNGNCTFCIPIRSFFIKEKGGYSEGFTQTCSGIVFDSVAEKEYLEIERKLTAIKKVLDSLK